MAVTRSELATEIIKDPINHTRNTMLFKGLVYPRDFQTWSNTAESSSVEDENDSLLSTAPSNSACSLWTSAGDYTITEQSQSWQRTQGRWEQNRPKKNKKKQVFKMSLRPGEEPAAKQVSEKPEKEEATVLLTQFASLLTFSPSLTPNPIDIHEALPIEPHPPSHNQYIGYLISIHYLCK